jgi:hypothetical protein
MSLGRSICTLVGGVADLVTGHVNGLFCGTSKDMTKTPKVAVKAMFQHTFHEGVGLGAYL